MNRTTTIWIIAALASVWWLPAQGQQLLPVVVNNDLNLAKGTYLADRNILIGPEAVLRLAPGSKVLLAPGVIIRVEGGMVIEGTESEFAEITSQDPARLGKGIMVTGISAKEIVFHKVRIHQIEMPLEFGHDWHRPLVSITGSEFKDNVSYTTGIFVRVPENIEVTGNCHFRMVGNSYINNIGGIYIENIDQANFQVTVGRNFVYGNRAYGAGLEGMLTSPFFFRSDFEDANKNFVLKDNVFDENFILDSEFDTVIHEVNVGVAGNASKVSIPFNYFGQESLEQKTKKMDHFSNNGSAPFLNIVPELSSPPQDMPPTVTSVMLNGQPIMPSPDFIFEPQPEIELALVFADEVEIANSSPQVRFTAYDEETETEVSGVLSTSVTWTDARTAVFRSKDILLSKVKRVFFTFTGIVSKSQFSVPAFYLGENGYKRFIAKNKAAILENKARFAARGGGPGGTEGNSPIDPALIKQLIERQDSLEKLLEDLKSNESKNYKDIMDEAEKQITFGRYFKGSYEFGAFVGTASYFGDLTGNVNFVDPEDVDWAFGLIAKYNFTERVTLSAGLIQGKLSGNESDNFRGSPYQDRGFEFYSPLTEINLNLEFNLNKLGFGNQGRFTPALSLGVCGFRYHPKTLYTFGTKTQEVSLYSLRTAGLPSENYSLISYGIPFGFHLKTVVKRRYLLDFIVSWRYTFTDFIDDFGEPGLYQDYAYFEKIFANSEMNGELMRDVAYNLHGSKNPDIYHKVGGNRHGSATDWYFVTGLSISYIKPNEKKVKPQ
ncbi:MAG: hypothetical protein HYZ16_12550 [Bacteroidetes bacterium]|jgi:putative transposon-encoded protein|nr:hypothetical protein [Bacteroidota bacterium]